MSFRQMELNDVWSLWCNFTPPFSASLIRCLGMADVKIGWRRKICNEECPLLSLHREPLLVSFPSRDTGDENCASNTPHSLACYELVWHVHNLGLPAQETRHVLFLTCSKTGFTRHVLFLTCFKTGFTLTCPMPNQFKTWIKQGTWGVTWW